MTRQKIVNKNGRDWLKSNMRPYNKRIAVITTLTTLATLLTLAFSYLVKFVVNGAVAENSSTVLIFALVLLTITIVRVGVSIANNYLAERWRARIFIGLRAKLFGRLMYGDYRSVQKYHSGDIVNRLTGDCHDVATASVNLTPNIVSMLVRAVGAVVALATLDWLFTVVYLICGLIVGGVTLILRKRLKLSHRKMAEAEGVAKSYMQENIASSLMVKAYSAEDKTTVKLSGFLNEYFTRRMQKNNVSTLIGGMFSLVNSLSMIFAIVWCCLKMISSPIDYGNMLAIVLLIGQLERPIAAFSGIVSAISIRSASAERLAELDAMPTEDVVEVNPQNGDITLSDIDFAYEDEKVLRGATCRINTGEVVCVTGESGSGKSTLFKLLLSVYAPTNGQICINESQLSIGDRRLFAYVPQGNMLFSGSILANLTFFAEKFTMDSVRKSLEIACATFVYDLPNGLDTQLNELGGGLSEGQIQRLAIARALIANRPILLLDEATSALDGQTEQDVLKNISALKYKTCIIVTHRPAALSIADRVFNVNEGKIYDVTKEYK